MKKYLKMSDVFEGEVKPKHIDEECIAEIVHGDDSGKNWTIEDSRYWMAMQYEHAGYTAHAINSHDELVAMNKELLAVVNNFRVTEPDEDGCVWLVLNGNGTTGMAMFNLGNGDRISAKVALHLESDRKSAISKARAAS